MSNPQASPAIGDDPFLVPLFDELYERFELSRASDNKRRELAKARYKIGVMDLAFRDWFRCDDRFYMSVSEAIWCKANGMPNVYIDWRTTDETISSLQGYREQHRRMYAEMLADGWFSTDRMLRKDAIWDRPVFGGFFANYSLYEEEEI